jgi:hypothetical protein
MWHNEEPWLIGTGTLILVGSVYGPNSNNVEFFGSVRDLLRNLGKIL